MTTHTLFGAPLGYEAGELRQWIMRLEHAWNDFSARRPGVLGDDLRELRRVYAHGASAKTLRAIAHQLPAATNDLPRLPTTLAIPIEDVELITPEGRITLEVLRRISLRDELIVDINQRIWALEYATRTRAEWYESWALKQFHVQLSPAPIAAALLVLLNNSVDESTAIPLSRDEDDPLGTTMLTMIGTFSDMLRVPFKREPTPTQNHWAFSQVTRHLGRDITRAAAPGRGSTLHITPYRERPLLETLRSCLAPHPEESRAAAVHGLVEAYLSARGLFAAAGVLNERPAHTTAVVAAVLDVVPR